jgi:hypothetical protein
MKAGLSAVQKAAQKVAQMAETTAAPTVVSMV